MKSRSACELAGVVVAHGNNAELSKCVQSLATVADAVYIGTTEPERDRDIARSVAAKLVPLEPTSKMGDSLNTVLSEVDEPWTFTLSPYEWVDAEYRLDLRALLSCGLGDCYELVTVHPEREGFRTFSTQARLFETHTQRFESRELARLAVQDAKPARKQPIRSNVAILSHRGERFDRYDAAVRAQLAAELAANPGDPFVVSLNFMFMSHEEFLNRQSEVVDFLERTFTSEWIPIATQIIAVVTKLYALLHSVGRDMSVPTSLTDTIDVLFCGNINVSASLVQQFATLRDFVSASRRLRESQMILESEAVDFCSPFHPAAFGEDTYRYFAHATTEDALRERYTAYGALPAPDPDPRLTTKRWTTNEGAEALWITGWMYRTLAQAVSDKGFRPDEYSRAQAVQNANKTGLAADECEWWVVPEELKIDRRQSGLFAKLLDQWASDGDDAPILLDTSKFRPRFQLLDPRTRWRKCATELAGMLKEGPVVAITRKEFRYVEIRRT